MTPYTGILTLANLKYFMSKDLSTKTVLIKQVLITQGDRVWNNKYCLQRLNQIGLYKTLIEDEFLMTLMKLRSSFLC